MHILEPEEKMMYTWDNPTGRQGFLWQLVQATNANWLSLSLEEVRQGDLASPSCKYSATSIIQTSIIQTPRLSKLFTSDHA